MPYVSDAQRRKFHVLEKEGKISHATVAEFDAASKGLKLPSRIDKPKNVVRHKSKYQGTPYVVPANVR